MAELSQGQLKALEELLLELQGILKDLKKEVKVEATRSSINMKVFFDSVRKTLFSGRLTANQVKGMEAKIKAFQEAGYKLSWAAYALATSYHETAKKMMPVREGLNASDAWRRKNLRYYPYYGRGDVQLTWRANYEKADRELNLGGALIRDLDVALDPDISARIMVRGMKEGWFTGKKLADYLTDKPTLSQYRNARRIINGMDKADLIANQAVLFERALKEAGYEDSNSR